MNVSVERTPLTERMRLVRSSSAASSSTTTSQSRSNDPAVTTR